MSAFLSDLVVKAVDDDTWELESALVYSSDLLKEQVIVPKGFVTDFASVPRIPFIFDLAGDTAHIAAVVHDYLYQTHVDADSRRVADKVFLEAMGVSKITKWRALAMYLGVRFGGSSSWKSGPQRFKVLNEDGKGA